MSIVEELAQVRATVGAIVDDARERGIENGGAWDYVEKLLCYVLDLSPASLTQIRLHTEIFTGEFLNHLAFAIRHADPEKAAVDNGYAYATHGLPEAFHIGEPEIPGLHDLGYRYRGHVVNNEVSRYQMYVANFARAGFFDPPTAGQQPGRTVFLQIGPGYGAMEHHLLRIAKGRVASIIVDLPLMLLFSSCYLTINNPGLRMLIHDPADPRPITDADLAAYDVIFVPHYRLDLLAPITRIDYAMNNYSLQEMSDQQITAYLDFIQPRLKQFFYVEFHERPEHPRLRLEFPKYFKMANGLEFHDEYMKTSTFHDPISGFIHRCYCFTDEARREAFRDVEIRQFMPDMAQRSIVNERILPRRW